MATVTGLTAARMLEIEGKSIVEGEVIGDDLILTKYDGTTTNAGHVVGATGPQGPQGIPGVAGVSSIPGEIKAWPNNVLPLQATYGKWVWADGAVYAVATYPIASGHINSAWNTAHGLPDPGAGNFRVPDLRGLILAGLDAMPGGSRANRMTRAVAITLAGKSGTETHIIQISEMPSHGHTISPGGVSGVISGGTGPPSGYEGQSLSAISISNNGGGAAHENVQPTVFVPYIVRLDG